MSKIPVEILNNLANDRLTVLHLSSKQLNDPYVFVLAELIKNKKILKKLI